MRRILCFLIIVATFSVCIGAAETTLLSTQAALNKSREEVRQVTLTADQPSAPKVALVTYGPGRLYWERFGHNAIIVDDPTAGERVAYNYGVFDFNEQHFLLNFAMGHMHYSLDAEPLEADLETYVAEGRSVTVQMLNLTPAQARQLAAFLAWNAQPQNADYRYDYFVNNCSTKVRDALNRALDGAIERQLAPRPAPHTYRFDAVRLISSDFWFALGMDMGLGPNADGPLSLWRESFVPMVLSRALRDVVVRNTNGDTLPLVSGEEVVLRGRLPPEPVAPSELRLPFLAGGVGLAALLLWLGLGKGRLYRTSFALLAVAWWLICGFSGVLLAWLWGLSDHWAAWHNENLLLLDPLCLILPVVWWRAPRIASCLATLLAAAALVSLIVRALPGLYQSNLAFIALTVPIHVVLAVLAWHQRSVAGIAGH
ncbi:MAG TPA: DUF4105 domain-containing protein [Steroidobacteraceae bacterium]|nr:DUF4105 domain-containing protein [Steroidobacteraceae bacterium]